jgi:hypothetical protein
MFLNRYLLILVCRSWILFLYVQGSMSPTLCFLWWWIFVVYPLFIICVTVEIHFLPNEIFGKMWLSCSSSYWIFLLSSAYMRLENIAECGCWICFVKHSIKFCTHQGILFVIRVMKKTIMGCPQQMIPVSNIPSCKVEVLFAR